MASVKLIFWDNKIQSNGKHPIAIQVLHKRKKKLFYLKHSLLKSEWDYTNNQPNTKNKNYRLIRARIKSAINEIEAIILELENTKKEYSLNDIAKRYNPDSTQNSDLTFVQYVDSIIKEQKSMGKMGNAKVYENTKGVFERFAGDKIKISDIDINTIKSFEIDLIKRGVKTNGISFQMRTLRAIINKAIKDDIIEEKKYPFKNYRIKSQKTPKRAVNKEVIIKIENFDTSETHKDLDLYKDLFLFSFYCRGMNFVDISYLKINNIKNDRIIYTRKKTHQQFNIKLTSKAKAIVDKYTEKKKSDDYLFPIIKRKDNEYLDYRNAMRLMNKKLKKISKILKLGEPITTYTTRHSWATIAKRSGIATAVISEGLGHTTEQITQVYLDSFENDILDDANDLITN